MAFRDGWNAFLYDTVTGLLGQQIDVPSFTWSMSVSDASFSTTKDKGFGIDDVSGLELPWGQIPGVDAAARASALMPYKRGLVLFWHSQADDPNKPGRPVLAGALGVRKSSQLDVSVPFVSMLGLLEDRYLVHEGRFGKGAGNSSPDEFRWVNLSYRALACETIRQCTEVKPGGALPIDLPYLGEHGTHQLPEVAGDEEDKPESGEKTVKKVNKSDGWVSTTVEADKTTVVDHTEKVTSKTVTVKEKYTVWQKGKRVERTRDKQKTIRTGRTVTEVKTETKPKGSYRVEKTVTKTVTTYSYDANGKETGSTKKTEGPTTTVEQKPTEVKYRDFNVVNHRCSDILRAIANSAGGPDMQFRPYLAEDGQHIRYQFLAGSDGDIYLHQDKRLSLAYAAGEASTLENITVDRAQPMMRVYGVGAGTGSGTLTYLAEDLSLVNRRDPWPLVETTFQDSKAEEIGLLRSGATAVLHANREPLMQVKGEINAFDESAGIPLHPLGSFWPGEMFDVSIQGFPDVPDGVYAMRLMQMSGDETGKVELTFDIMADPVT